MNNAFSVRVYNSECNPCFDHVRSDACHIGDIAKRLSLLLDCEVAVSAFSALWLVFESGRLKKRFDHYGYLVEAADTREIALMFQNAPKS